MPTIKEAQRMMVLAIKERDDRIMKLKAAGITNADIARILGVSYQRVNQIVGRLRNAADNGDTPQAG